MPSQRSAAGRPTRRTASRTSAPPVLVRQIRGGIVESMHRGHIVEVDLDGRPLRLLGDPDHLVTLRSTIKPFGLLALLDADGVDGLALQPAEIAIMASSHSGEDVHVRTLQDLYRRARVSQSMLACGSNGMPLDGLTAARLARDGERAGSIRHMCSGYHSVFILLSRLAGWPVEQYWEPEHPAQRAYREAVARAFGVPADELVPAVDGCGVPTYARPLREVARAFALLADPVAVGARDPRSKLAPGLARVRDAMLTHPEMVGGNRDRLDTSLVKAAPGRLVSKSGSEALRGVAILRGARASTPATPASGLAIKIEDGDGHGRASWAASVEALRQAGVLEGQALRALGRYHRPPSLDAHGHTAAEAVASFDLAPVGELLGR